jgi:hypothetical protein
MRVAIVLLLAVPPTVAFAAAQPLILGSTRADLLVGRDGSDRIVARAGADRISAEYDGGIDRISCGPGRDVVAIDARDRVERDCEVVSTRVHRDRQSNVDSQHESQVEPDSYTFGATTVAVFQNGRNRTGGAASIAFSTSKDGGRTWRQGILPGLTLTSTPPGAATRASDPTVAYDSLHGVWLANTLAIASDSTRLTIHRSRDGLVWTGPIDAARAPAFDIAYDKNWLACDNTAASPFYGRCYLAYTLVGEQQGDDSLAVQHSIDGGVTWSAAATARVPVTGVIPVVQPNGALTLVFWSQRASSMVAVRSTDGGLTLGEPVTIAPIQAKPASPFRAPPVPAADVDGAGRVIAVWQDCRFRPDCQANDVVFSRSSDGVTWSPPARATRNRNAVMPTIGAEPGTGRLAIAYYTLRPDGVDAELVTSRDGSSWSSPQRLTPRRMPLTWMPETTLGRMLADYIGVSWSRGRPLVIYALASPPRKRKLRQAIYAGRG